MKSHDGELPAASIIDETVVDLRELSVQCSRLLYKLSADEDSTDGAGARDATASFNIWTTNMGIFREGHQSLASRLISAPLIGSLVRQLLLTLKHDLENVSNKEHLEELAQSSSESDDSSDRSCTSPYRLFSPSDNEDSSPPVPERTVWNSIQRTINSLGQLASSIRLAGTQHRQERIERFRGLGRNKQIYEVFETCARQKVDYLYSKASVKLRGRMAESIANRRIRFLYLQQHQQKVSTLNTLAPLHKQKKASRGNQAVVDGDSVQPAAQKEQQPVPTLSISMEDPFDSIVQPSVAFSTTEVTKLDPKLLHRTRNDVKRAESVTSVDISTGTLPSVPRLDPGGISFTCPYCLLVCPAKEISGQRQWMSHLIRDFEPFFCVFENCSSPFTCAGTYDGWLSHMSAVHTQAAWHCWHCQAAISSFSPFPSQEELTSHLEEFHGEEVTESLRPTVLKYGMVRDKHPLKECPFCGGFPEDIEKLYPERDSSQSQEALEKHVRDHLVTVALIMTPVEETEQLRDLDGHGAESAAQRGNDSERDLEGIGDTYDSNCSNTSCDCKRNTSISDLSSDPVLDGWEIEDMRAILSITETWKEIFDGKAKKGGDSTSVIDANHAPAYSAPTSPLPFFSSPSWDQNNPEAIIVASGLNSIDPRLDKQRIIHEKGGLLKDSYQWILEQDEFTSWCQNQESQLLWITGNAGKGKTMLLGGIIDELSSSSPLVSFFVPQRTDPKRNNATAIMRGLVYLLCEQIPALTCYVKEMVYLEGPQCFESDDGFIPMAILLTCMLLDPVTEGCYMVVDALDECIVDQHLLFRVIGMLVSEVPVKWIVSSRHRLNTADAFHLSNLGQKLCLEHHEKCVTRAVGKYIDWSVAKFEWMPNGDQQTLQMIHGRLRSQADGTFLWASSVINEILGSRYDNLKLALEVFDGLPLSLKRLYSEMLKEVLDQQLKGDNITLEVLSTVASAYKSPSLPEIRVSAHLSNEVGIEDIRRVVESCPLLKIHRGRVAMVHESVHQYLRMLVSQDHLAN